jgi:hypothetical protein
MISGRLQNNFITHVMALSVMKSDGLVGGYQHFRVQVSKVGKMSAYVEAEGKKLSHG